MWPQGAAGWTQRRFARVHCQAFIPVQLARGILRDARVCDARVGTVVGSELAVELHRSPSLPFVIMEAGTAYAVGRATSPDAYHWIEAGLRDGRVFEVDAALDAVRAACTVAREAGAGAPGPGWSSEMATALSPIWVHLDDTTQSPDPLPPPWLPPEWKALWDGSGCRVNLPPVPAASPVIAHIGGTLESSQHLRHQLWLLTTRPPDERTTAVEEVIAAVQRHCPDAPGRDELWKDPRWAGLLTAPQVVAGLRQQAMREGKTFSLSSLSTRVERVANLFVTSPKIGGTPRLAEWARRQQRSLEAGRSSAAPLLERPRSDDITEMVAATRRFGWGWPDAVSDPPADSRAYLHTAPYLAAHRAAHGCFRECYHAGVVLRVARAAPLLWNAGVNPDIVTRAPPSRHPEGEAAEVVAAKVAELVSSGVLEDVTEDSGRHPIFNASIFTVYASTLIKGHLVAAADAALRTGDDHDLSAVATSEAAAIIGEAAAGAPTGSPSQLASAFMVAWQSRADPGKLRAVYDGRGLSAHLATLSLTMGDVGEIAAAVTPGSWMATVDLKGGFHQLVTDVGSRRHLGAAWGGRLYRWCRLPFRTSQAPFLCCLVTAELTYILRRLYVG